MAGKHLTDATKAALLRFLRSRAAAGEGSLKTWGQGQRPLITFGQAEEIADALVADGLATKETRRGGEFVWRAVIATEPTPPEPTHVEPVVTRKASVSQAPENPPDSEEPVLVAGGDAPCEECARLGDALRNAADYRPQMIALQEECDRLREQLDTAHQREVQRRGTYQAPPVDPGAIAHYLLDLPEERWTGLAQARKGLAQGRRLTEHGARLQAEALAAVDRLLDTSAGTPAAKPAKAPSEPARKRAVRTGEEPPANTLLGQTLALVRAGKAHDQHSVAKALGRSPGAARSDLRTLEARGLLERTSPGRWVAVGAGKAAAQ